MTENNSKQKKISVLGCGWYGLEMAKQLVKNGYEVKGSSTTPAKIPVMQQLGITPFIIDFQESEENYTAEFFDCDTLLISIPPKRSTAEQHTFLSKINRISATAIQCNIRDVIFISSTSVYGDSNEEVTEDSAAYPETASGKAVLAAELFLKQQTAFNTTIIRFGGLTGPGRDPGRFFAGKTAIPNGNAPVNLIHLSDCIGITLQIIEKQAFGHTYNACAPGHPSRKYFYTQATLKSGLEAPVFIDELLNWKLVTGKNIKQYLDYKFQVSFL
jgi:nucleoside-diphosphate-sugar epimerase